MMSEVPDVPDTYEHRWWIREVQQTGEDRLLIRVSCTRCGATVEYEGAIGPCEPEIIVNDCG
jgi:hypothetical protein